MNLRDWFPFVSSGDGDEEETAPVEPATGLSPIPTGIVETVADEWPADFSQDDLEYTLNAVQDYAIKAYGPTAYPGIDEDAGSELTGHPIAELVHHPEQTSDLEELFHADDNEGVEGYIIIAERWDAIREDLDMSQLALDAVQESHRLYAIDLEYDEYGSLLNPLFVSTDNPPAIEGEVADNPETDASTVASGKSQSETGSDHTGESEQQTGPTEPAEESSSPMADTDTVADTPCTQADPDSQTSPASPTDTAMSESEGSTADDSERIDIELAELSSGSSESPTTESERTDTASESSIGSAATEDTLSPDTEDAKTAETDGSGETINSIEESPFAFDDPSEVDRADDDTSSESTDDVRSVNEIVKESSFVFETGDATTDESPDDTDGGTSQPSSSISSPSSTTTPAPAEASTPTGGSAADQQDDSAEAEWAEWMLAAVEPQHSRQE